MTIEDLKARLENVTRSGAGYTASCPCKANHKHSDRENSFSFSQSENGRILVYCHTGCKFEEICAALECSPADLAPDTSYDEPRVKLAKWYAKQNGFTFEALYSYCYGRYNDGLAKAKFRQPNGDKTFRWIKADPSKRSGYGFSHDGCESRLYVSGNIEDNNIFIAEGEKDADTIHALTGYTAVSAENGAKKGDKNPGKKWKPEYISQLAGKTCYIIYDNDEAGRNFAAIEADTLTFNARYVFMMNLLKVWPDCPEGGDISDLVKAKGKDEAAALFDKLIDLCEAYEANTNEDKAHAPGCVDAVDNLLSKAETHLYEPIPTGLPGIDKALAGGFLRQTLVTLGAAPALGKTILCQQIAENMAKHGAAVLYFNLEMSVDQLLARSISRATGYTSLKVLQGYAWTEVEEARIRAAATKYKAEIAPNISYNPPMPDGTSGSAFYQDILSSMKAAKRAEWQPLICFIDYLQLLRDKEGKTDAAEIIKAALKAFKDFAIESDAVVVLIMAHNRDTNEKGTVTQTSGRDTSAIEYSGDTQISLSYTKIADRTYSTIADIEKAIKNGDMIPGTKTRATDKIYNLRSFCVTKHRFSAADRNTRADLLFIGEESRFSLIDDKH